MRIFARIPAPVWLVLVAAALRLANLGGEHFWYDEAFSAWTVRPSTDFWMAVTGDTQPPLWPIIQLINARLFGINEFSFRLPGALLSVGAVLLVWAIARQMGLDQRTAFVAGLLAALMPGNIYAAQDARMYSALTFFALISLWSALRNNWYLFALGAAATVYTQTAGLFYVAALGFVILISAPTRNELAKRLVALAIVALVYLPWLSIMLAQAARVGQAFWTPPLTAGGFLWPAAPQTLGWRMPETFYVVAYGVAFAILFVGLIKSRSWLYRRQSWPLLAVLVGGPLLLAIVSLIWRPIYIARVVLPSTTLLALLWAYPLVHLARPARGIALSAVLPMLAIGLLFHYLPGHGRIDITDQISPITLGWQDGDVIYHTSATTAVVYGWYSQDKPYAVAPFPGDVIQITDQCRQAFGLNMATLEQLSARGYRRAWVVVNWSPFTRRDEQELLHQIAQERNPRYIAYEVIEAPLMHDEIMLVNLE